MKTKSPVCLGPLILSEVIINTDINQVHLE